LSCLIVLTERSHAQSISEPTDFSIFQLSSEFLEPLAQSVLRPSRNFKNEFDFETRHEDLRNFQRFLTHNVQRLLFETSPILLLACLAVAIAGSWFLYRAKSAWGKWTNRLLFLFRTTLLFSIAVLLLGPILKLITNTNEKPEVVLMVDNSQSVREVFDSVRTSQLLQQLGQTKEALEDEGYTVSVRGISGAVDAFSQPTSDLSSALRDVEAEYNDRNLASIVLVSDGIYNTGVSPLYSNFKIPIHTVGMGDTVQRKDLVLNALRYNKVAYQGNKFPLQAEVLVHALPDQLVHVTVLSNGKAIAKTQQPSANKTLLVFDFQLDAEKAGIQRFDVLVQGVASETNLRNNAVSAFIEVVEGKKKILLVAPAPHPDIKALRAVVEKNSNYEFVAHIPSVKETDVENLIPEKIDLAIFHQSPDIRGLTSPLFNKLKSAKIPIFIVLGQQSNLRQLPTAGIALSFETVGQWDETFGIPADEFSAFQLPENLNNSLSRYPPLVTPFGKFAFPPEAKSILYQRIGSVPTRRPLLWYLESEQQKIAVLAGEGIWRWRLKEFHLNENTETFDAFFGKFIQFMSSKDDRRKFRSFPIKQQFNDTEYVMFESQIFNDVYEPQYGSEVTLDILDEKGRSTRFTYTPTAARPQYQFNLAAGAYRYSASITRNNKLETDRGQFSVSLLQIESQNLTADFQLLRTLATNTGGQFFKVENLIALQNHLQSQKAPVIVHSDESFHPLIDLKLLFVALLILVSTEWFFRKFLGSY
jgi:hypothetical protein